MLSGYVRVNMAGDLLLCIYIYVCYVSESGLEQFNTVCSLITCRLVTFGKYMPHSIVCSWFESHCGRFCIIIVQVSYMFASCH